MNHDLDDQTTSRFRTGTLTPKEKERVDSADAPFNQRRCLMENYSHGPSVRYCHLMDSKNARTKDLMASLEWNWNMPYGALNLNTRYNIFFAGAALHLHYDNDSWGLLPERSIIDYYYARLDEE
ncbi:hypothetical protein Agabi119p4_11577 [Agaricus bisporus var. burnettii]|uniref:Uncharacterized protein n=1 Tax=Agaricus bisporus var. burnettii TaxID=192524 RepID=A0A8H7EVA9_AGABI|nr:hypothetical protein Agabi119p4_11577 [Agaricus bisporus var. burnettii]